MQFKGQIFIEDGGDYGFRLNSDNGSRLFIDGQQVIDNGIQMTTPSMVDGSLRLLPGWHEIQVDYYAHLENR